MHYLLMSVGLVRVIMGVMVIHAVITPTTTLYLWKLVLCKVGVAINVISEVVAIVVGIITTEATTTVVTKDVAVIKTIGIIIITKVKTPGRIHHVHAAIVVVHIGTMSVPIHVQPLSKVIRVHSIHLLLQTSHKICRQLIRLAHPLAHINAAAHKVTRTQTCSRGCIEGHFAIPAN